MYSTKTECTDEVHDNKDNVRSSLWAEGEQGWKLKLGIDEEKEEWGQQEREEEEGWGQQKEEWTYYHLSVIQQTLSFSGHRS